MRHSLLDLGQVSVVSVMTSYAPFFCFELTPGFSHAWLRMYSVCPLPSGTHLHLQFPPPTSSAILLQVTPNGQSISPPLLQI